MNGMLLFILFIVGVEVLAIIIFWPIYREFSINRKSRIDDNGRTNDEDY